VPVLKDNPIPMVPNFTYYAYPNKPSPPPPPPPPPPKPINLPYFIYN